MKIKIKKLHPDAIIPDYNKDYNRFDIYACMAQDEQIILYPDTSKSEIIETGLRITMPKDFNLELISASGALLDYRVFNYFENNNYMHRLSIKMEYKIFPERKNPESMMIIRNGTKIAHAVIRYAGNHEIEETNKNED